MSVCKSLVVSYYERALEFIEIIRQAGFTEILKVLHVYREFNADADATANEVIDRFLASNAFANRAVIQENWFSTQLSQICRKPSGFNFPCIRITLRGEDKTILLYESLLEKLI